MDGFKIFLDLPSLVSVHMHVYVFEGWRRYRLLQKGVIVERYHHVKGVKKKREKSEKDSAMNDEAEKRMHKRRPEWSQSTSSTTKKGTYSNIETTGDGNPSPPKYQ